MLSNKNKKAHIDIPTQVFLILRDHFFDSKCKPKSFQLRDKLSTQDDPLDEYLNELLTNKLDYNCVKASPLVSPDLVVFHEDFVSSQIKKEGFEDLTNIVAIEVKKLMRTDSGSVARRSGLDYNSTPPCGKVRIYNCEDKILDIRAFYLFVCQEEVPEEKNKYKLTALVICDGNALNMDFNLYLSTIEGREKEIGIGTYEDGINRNRPMFVFSNPLGLSTMDNNVTLIHSNEDLDKKCDQIGKVFCLKRSIGKNHRMFSCYRKIIDIPQNHKIIQINDFPKPSKRETKAQSRGKFRLPL